MSRSKIHEAALRAEEMNSALPAMPEGFRVRLAPQRDGGAVVMVRHEIAIADTDAESIRLAKFALWQSICTGGE